MKESLMIGAACLLVGGGLGYMTGGQNKSSAQDSESAGGEIRSSKRTSSSPQNAETRAFTSYEEITSQPGQTARIQALIDLYSNLEPHQFADEAEKLDSLPFSERILAAYLLFASWAESSPTDAMDHARTKMGFAGNFVKPTVLQSWAASDPIGASVYYQENKAEFSMMGMMGRRGGRGGQSGAALVAAEWAKQDPAAALKWAGELKGRDGDQATASALKELAKTDPAKAAEMIQSVEESNRSAAYESIASEWAKTDWGKTESWISTLPADEQESAMSAAVVSLASENPTLAADKVLNIDDLGERDEAMEIVAGQLAKSDPAGAMDWVMKNASEEGRREAVGDVIRPWVAQDPQGALSWVNRQEEGPVRDSAVSAYIFNDQSASGSDKVSLAETITDDRRRDRTLGMAAYQWISQDKEAGTAYLESTDALSEEAKKRVLRRANR